MKQAAAAYQKQAQYEKLDASSYATGGYTGDWGDNGKLAILHEKELILNKDDTERILSAITVVRTLDNILDGFRISSTGNTNSNIISNLVNSTNAVPAN